ncbi:MAG TPA: CAAX prenyl protease-related protein [Bryobacteraceae bacterium]|nr:CAAX prenyl protease-related protein [Bryobacteraceae bacterium]
MEAATQSRSWLDNYQGAKYVAPFLIFIAFLAISSELGLDARWDAPLRVIVLAVVCLICWPRELPILPVKPVMSIAVGTAVFVLWIAPDFLFPGYRQSVLLSNSFTGHLHSSLRPSELQSTWVLVWRSIRAVVIVPIVEELFWRGWMMRWIINIDFQKVPLGAYTPLAFWITAILFAAEHGPYWDVGLVTGIIYNLWMIRTKSVSDCILMHAVTNAILSAYVIGAAQWQYWQ